MSPPPFKNYDEAVRLYEAGIPIAEIARRQVPKVTKQAVWNALKRRGVLRPPFRPISATRKETA
jgi:hypothetical protein